MGMSLVPILASRGDEVFVTSRQFWGNSKKSAADSDKIHYLHGDAHEELFLREVLKNRYDVIVDFMSYSAEEFYGRVDLLLASCAQYVFLSSSRVYAESAEKLTEESPLLLDVCENKKYLKTAEYALDKAREENILKGKEVHNWTIIRPYITYNSNRLQLGCYEKEDWLYRALNGKTIVFMEDIARRRTTLTYGQDVAEVMGDLIGKENAKGEIVHIASDDSITWGEILKIYLEVIEDMTGRRVQVLWLKDYKKMEAVMNPWQVRYDRLYNRMFDSKKSDKICGKNHEYIEAQKGLAMCLKKFIGEGAAFRRINWNMQAYMDKLTNERTDLSVIPGWKQKLKYLICRYTPYMQIRYRIRCFGTGK